MCPGTIRLDSAADMIVIIINRALVSCPLQAMIVADCCTHCLVYVYAHKVFVRPYLRFFDLD